MGGLEVLSESKSFDIREEKALWGFAGRDKCCGGESKDEEVEVIGESHCSDSPNSIPPSLRRPRDDRVRYLSISQYLSISPWKYLLSSFHGMRD